ncbi:hypothetical protein BDK88_0573 [Natrinema hispanicum]|uniref:Uncharacterized protein n=1 Tax=Natrinema hispanicum TaxID=392421 RepID=A0A482YIE8_9EURY|nr:hypothetical protein [Natrinema hispanicum]RZV11692.1 hypothetical protein BDK88_0573 [Natrinema hispanicum]
MRFSIPGIPGIYVDTDGKSTAKTVALTAAGRRAPKPQGYALQFLPYLWSFDIDLREVPTEHPIQYLHPEGAQSVGTLTDQRGVRGVGTELESVLRFAWSVNQEVESATSQLLGMSSDDDGVTIEIQDGAITADGSPLETDEFDVGETEIEIDDADPDGDDIDDEL